MNIGGPMSPPGGGELLALCVGRTHLTSLNKYPRKVKQFLVAIVKLGYSATR